jgi:hypothetical protein
MAGGGRFARHALSPPHLLDESEADAEPAGELALRAFTLIVSPRDLSAEVRRVSFHNSESTLLLPYSKLKTALEVEADCFTLDGFRVAERLRVRCVDALALSALVALTAGARVSGFGLWFYGRAEWALAHPCSSSLAALI